MVSGRPLHSGKSRCLFERRTWLRLLGPDDRRRRPDTEKVYSGLHGLDVTEDNLRALEAILAASAMNKSEDPDIPQEAVAVTEDGSGFAAAVQRAIAADRTEHVQLGGKHSAGSMVASDPDTDLRYLLKPGAGGQPPAAGANESGASQSKREAAFWAVAMHWGMGEDLPEAHLVLLDGREYAAMQLLGSEYKTALQFDRKDHGYVRRVFHMRRPDGTLHRWATLDYVLGNSDRHAQNIMLRGEEVQLIDHGSALAGAEFAPATDKFTFIPFYLRVLAPPDFSDWEPHEQLRHLPRLHPHQADEFGKWLHALDDKMLEETLHRYGIEAEPAVRRLKSVQAATGHSAPDLAILQAWVLP